MRTSSVKKLHGFNTQYSYAADYDLILRAYLSGISTAVYNHPYAYYDNRGMSSVHYDVTFRECTQIAAKLLGLSEKERIYLGKKRILPCRVIIRSALFRDPIIRKSAFHQLLRFIFNFLGLLGPRGGFKKKVWS